MPPGTLSVEPEMDLASKKSSKCSQCKEEPARYRCPGCSAHTCGLECVKSHKAESGCSGKRDRTAFVALQQFDDSNLVSDYNFLEEVSQESEAAKRIRTEIGVQGPPGRNEGLPGGMRMLQLEALNRGVTLRFLSWGMTRRTQNSSFFDKKRKCLFWRVEWHFSKADVTLIDGKCDENTVIGDAVGRHLSGEKVTGGNQQSSREKLGAYVEVGVDLLRFFITHHPSPANEKKFVEMDGSKPVRSELDALTVIEFPRIHVALPSEVHLYPTVEIERRRKQQEPRGGISKVEVLAEDGRGQIGKLFREEDIGGGTN